MLRNSSMLGIFLGCFLQCQAIAPATAGAFNSESEVGSALTAAEQTIRAILQSHLEAGEFPGAAVCLHLPGEGEVLVSVGQSIPDQNGTPFDPDQPLNIGSLTKSFVAVVVMQLIESGDLELGESLDAWFPDLPDGDQITVRDLLQHTGGLREYFESAEVLEELDRPWSPEELIQAALRMESVGQPGGEHHYSNTNYMLLGELIRKVTGQPWYAEIRTRVLEPLGLGLTAYPEEPQSPDMGPAYSLVDGRFVDTTKRMHISLGGSAGGLISTPRDMMTFLLALREGRLLNERSWADMRSYLPAGSYGHVEHNYGLGWEQYVANELTLEGHMGTGVHTAFVGFEPTTGSAITIVINVAQPGLTALISAEIVGAVLGRNIAPPMKTTADVSYMYLPESRLMEPPVPAANDLGVQISSIRAELLFPFSSADGRSVITHGPRYQQLRLDYANRSPDLGPLVERVHMLGYSFTWFQQLNPRWTLLSIVNPGMASDFKGDLSVDDLVLEMAVVGIKTINDRWALGFGAGYNPRFGQHYPMPVLALRWGNGSDKEFEAILPMSMKFDYRPRPGLGLGLGLELEGSSYHGDPELFEVDNPQMRYSLAKAGPSLAVDLGHGARLLLKGGFAFGRRFEFFDGTEEMASYDLESAGFLQAGITVGH